MSSISTSWNATSHNESSLQIVDVKPAHKQENVDYQDPAIRVAFSEVLAADSLAGNVEVFTMSNSGDELIVAGTTLLVDSNELTFFPSEPLLDGVIYEVRVKGGEGGIRSVIFGPFA